MKLKDREVDSNKYQSPLIGIYDEKDFGLPTCPLVYGAASHVILGIQHHLLLPAVDFY